MELGNHQIALTDPQISWILHINILTNHLFQFKSGRVVLRQGTEDSIMKCDDENYKIILLKFAG